MSLVALSFNDILSLTDLSRNPMIPYGKLLGQSVSKIASCYKHLRYRLVFFSTCILAKGDLWNPNYDKRKKAILIRIAYIF